MNSNQCQPKSLRELLLSDVETPAELGLIAHVDQCPHCQEQLNELAGAPEFWSETRTLADSAETAVPDMPPTDTVVLATIGDTEEVPSTSLLDVASHLAPPRHPEMLGSVGKYDVHEEVGRGGMSIVLKGFDSELNRPVAVKLLAPHLASSGVARQRFVREARAAAAVVHDNVVAIHGIESDGPLPAIVMPLIVGSSLHEHVDRNGPVDVVDIVRIGTQIASGLAAAHAQGLVHRDIKPANILLENGLNRVQITDFGLARAAHDANLTHSGVIAGTPYFMSPEQASGEGVDHRSDLFSLGSVLYFMATGELPFAATTPMGVLQRVCTAVPTPARELNPTIPAQLESIIEKLLEKNPADRFHSANQLHEYLDDYLAHLQQPTSRSAPRSLVTSRTRQRRNRLLHSIVAIVALAAISLAAWFLAPTNKGPANRASATTPPPTTFESLGVSSDNRFDSELKQLSDAVQQLERTARPASEAFFATPKSPRASWASQFDKEVRSIDASLRQLEQSDRATPPSP